MNKLAALTGVYVSQLETQLAAKTKVPVAGGELMTRLPIDLVKNRGDIQFARLNVVAAAAERAANVASLFPTIGLTAAVGEQRQDNGQLPAISQHIWSVGPALFWPVLDFGALDAAIEVSRLKEHEALIRYKQTVQTAVSDVETHAEAYKRALARTQSLESAVSASVDSSRYAEDRYKHGLTDYLHVIDAYRSEDAIAREYTDALVQTSSEWASLQVSLGQGQDSFRVSDHPFTPKPAIIAMFNRLFESTPSKP
jgi:outer membrane protein TolC